ncbi:hypothetical protein HYW17_02425 [Candidatus Uhrbacteria bacterium]|nr:hypothetical protein [Candidatus Uhrbacteria bacterium]
MGFADDTTACLRCVEEEVERQETRASEIWQRLIHALPASHVSALIGWATAARAFTSSRVEICLLRAVDHSGVPASYLDRPSGGRDSGEPISRHTSSP